MHFSFVSSTKVLRGHVAGTSSFVFTHRTLVGTNINDDDDDDNDNNVY